MDPRPRDYADAAQDMASDPTDLAVQLASLKGEANAWLCAPDYNTLQLSREIVLGCGGVNRRATGCG